jgi:hypothetical protein
MKRFHFARPFFFFLAVTILVSSIIASERRPLVFRMSQLEEAKKIAIAEDKPIAWIATANRYLVFHKNLLGKNSHSATTYAIRALQNDAIIIFSDTETENHQEPGLVNQALHTPDAHYNVPGVVILTPSLDKVITKTFYKAEPQERAKEFADVLKKIRDKKSWQKKKPGS